jgi:CRP/FNR family transcriptional regulator, nitrogen oxide reductase regulator
MKTVSNEMPTNTDIPLLAGLSPSEMADVLALGRTLEVEPKARICTAGDRAEHVFVLLNGRVKYSWLTAKGDEIILRLFAPYESFGFATLLPKPLNYLGTAESLSACALRVWNHDEMTRLCSRYPQINTNALRIALQLLEAVSDRHCNLLDGSASRRVARALIDIGRRSGEIHSQGIDVHITNEQLASLADVSRYTVSRVLSGWNKAGVVTKLREKVRIHSPEDLLS